ncbi:hypothetical protein QQ045_028911 [Rhodiola kirilowii]
MADHHHHQLQTHQNGVVKIKKILVLACMLPLTFTLFTLAGLSLAGALVGLAVTVPVFVLFSPVLVPAAVVIGVAVTGFLSSGAVGLAAVTVLFWVYHYLRMSMCPSLEMILRAVSGIASLIKDQPVLF